MRPTCPICNGVGFVEEPYYSDFAPTTRPIPCPQCRPVTEVSNAGCWMILALLGSFAFLIVWCMP